MAITQNSSRQYPLVARVTFIETDLPAAATYAAVDVPANSIVTGGYLEVGTLFDGGADNTLTISGGGCSTAAIDVDATGGSTGLTALTLTGVVNAAGDTVDVTLGGTIAGTAGVASLVVEYIIVDRDNENQDN